MTVLGIDSSSKDSAFVYWDGSLLGCGKAANSHVCDLVRMGGYDVLAVETPQLFGKSVYPEVMETAVQAGVFMGMGIAAGCDDVRRYSRQETSLHCAGVRSCPDTKLKQCLIERFGPVGTKKAKGPLYGLVGTDMWDALSIAVIAHDKTAPALALFSPEVKE